MMRQFPSVLILACCAVFLCSMEGQTPQLKMPGKGPVMSRHAEGTFEAKTTPLAGDEALAGTLLGRYQLVKEYHGDLEGTSKGEMLAAGDPKSGNAGYVAIEEMKGTVNGHAGSFALQHIGLMENGAYKLSVVVVPGSGSGELKGISGTMEIIIAGGKHSYRFEYMLAGAE